jgi:hypothetical protein
MLDIKRREFIALVRGRRSAACGEGEACARAAGRARAAHRRVDRDAGKRSGSAAARWGVPPDARQTRMVRGPQCCDRFPLGCRRSESDAGASERTDRPHARRRCGGEMPDSFTLAHRELIVSLTTRQRLPGDLPFPRLHRKRRLALLRG